MVREHREETIKSVSYNWYNLLHLITYITNHVYLGRILWRSLFLINFFIFYFSCKFLFAIFFIIFFQSIDLHSKSIDWIIDKRRIVFHFSKILLFLEYLFLRTTLNGSLKNYAKSSILNGCKGVQLLII